VDDEERQERAARQNRRIEGYVVSLMHVEPFRAMRDLDRFTSQLLSGTRVPLSMPMDVWRDANT
jgi:hypothetical protein